MHLNRKFILKLVSKMVNIFLFMLCLFFHQTADAQFDQEKFEKIFEEETGGDKKYSERKNHSAKYSYEKSQALPQWFFTPPIADGGSIVAIGISDPGLDSADAVNMAIYRAQLMANVLRKSTTQLLCDFFLNDQSSAQQIVYEHFSRILTQMPDSAGGVEIIETYTNAFDETMVLINYKPPEVSPDLRLNKVFLELYKNETEASIYGGFESIYELQVKHNGNKQPSMFYQLTEYGPRNNVVGAVYDINYDVPIYSLSYTCMVSDSINKMHLSHGLWKEYFKSVINNVLMAARQKPENIKIMGDKYQEEAIQSDTYEKLTRGLSVNKMSFVLEGIKPFEHTFAVSLREVSLVEPPNLLTE